MPYLDDVQEIERTVQGIYVIRNRLDGKVYVGSARRVAHRWWQHQRDLEKNEHGNRHLQGAWLKYGAATFDFRLLEVVPDSKNLLEREQHHMDVLNASDRKFGYNLQPLARSSLGVRRTDETRARCSLAALARPPREPWTQAARDNLSRAKKGCVLGPLTEAHKEKLSDVLTGRLFTAEHCAKIGAANRLRVLSDETKDKIRKSNTGYRHSAEAKQRMSDARKGIAPIGITPRPIEMIDLVCAFCQGTFQRRAKTERFQLKSGTRSSGPFCGPTCRNRGKTRVKET